jgi:hypothetical protein
MGAKYPEDKEKVWNLACKYLVAGKEYKYYKIERVEPTNEIIRTNIKGKQNFIFPTKYKLDGRSFPCLF